MSRTKVVLDKNDTACQGSQVTFTIVFRGSWAGRSQTQGRARGFDWVAHLIGGLRRVTAKYSLMEQSLRKSRELHHGRDAESGGR